MLFLAFTAGSTGYLMLLRLLQLIMNPRSSYNSLIIWETSKYNQKDKSEISWTHNTEDKSPGFKTQGTYGRQERH